MKFFLPVLTVSLVAVGASLQAAPDFSPLNEGVDQFFKAMDEIVKRLPGVDDAAGTAGLVNRWAEANENFAAVGEKFEAANPGVINQNPPELAAALGRLQRMKTDYAAVPAGVGPLMKRFQSEPQVLEAIQRFKKSIDRVQVLSQKR